MAGWVYEVSTNAASPITRNCALLPWLVTWSHMGSSTTVWFAIQ